MIKMKSKKGALELSMNTIVVIVIAAIVLSLSLVFVKNMFDKVTKTGDQSMEAAMTSLDNLETYEGTLTLSPGTVDVKSGGTADIKIIIANEETESLYFTLKASSVSDSTVPAKVRCVFADTQKEISKPITLKSGQGATLKMLVRDLKGGLGTTSCSVEMQTTADISDKSDELIINVVKS